jgi:xylulokinase
MAEIDRDKLPPLLPVNCRIGTLRGRIAAELGLPVTTAVFSGSNDTQAASVAVGAFRTERGGINIGSTAQILARAASKKTDLDRDLFTMPSPIRADWLVLAENGLAGKSLDLFLRRVVFAKDGLADHSMTPPFDRIERALRATPALSDGLLFLPWLTGSESPAPNDRVRGAFINISVNTNRELMVRAILEGVSFSLRWLSEEVESFRAEALHDLRFSGGGARSDGWAQILADVMGRTVRQLDNAGYAGCTAAAFLAFKQLSLVDLGCHGTFFPSRKRFAPGAGRHEAYDRQYEHFLHSLRCNVPAFDALNG